MCVLSEHLRDIQDLSVLMDLLLFVSADKSLYSSAVHF